MDIEADLLGIHNLLRRHIEIRNRSWMKRVHRDCFIGSEAVDFLVTQGLADNRKQAVEIGRKMVSKKMVRHVTDSQKFGDSYHYYRFAEDDLETSVLAQSNAGNGLGTHLGHGGCKWSFCPHTSHNSYVLDVALAEEIERAVAGASVEARAHAIQKLRSRVREQAETDAPDWNLTQSTQVNKTMISVFQRKRPRGEWKNVKMTGMVGESPVGFIKGIMSFQKRKQWESMFEDGVVVEGIDIGEAPSVLLKEDKDENISATAANLASPFTSTKGEIYDPDSNKIAVPDAALKGMNLNIARKTDDVLTFLQTVDTAGVPVGMAIAFLNDPERQHALAHLRKQMMLSNPQECMLCSSGFESSADIRFCPCCAMVSCASCVSKRVFEVVSRQVVSVCVHCFRESSRVRHPPQAVLDSSGIDVSLRGKWWRPEELGMVDYSQSMQAPSVLLQNASKPVHNRKESTGGPSIYNENDLLVLDSSIRPLIPGILDDIDPSVLGTHSAKKEKVKSSGAGGETDSDDDEEDDEEDSDPLNAGGEVESGEVIDEYKDLEKAKAAAALKIPPVVSVVSPSPAALSLKTARCKSCGLMISRDMEAIEAHMEECNGPQGSTGRKASVAGGSTLDGKRVSVANDRSYVLNGTDGQFTMSSGTSKAFGNITRKAENDAHGTRIIYRTARTQSKMFRPREVCAIQDSFVDSDGSCYVYEISVRHCDVRGINEYVTADVMLLMHVAKPVKGSKNMSNITIISQVDTRSKGPQWLLSFVAEEGSNNIGVLGKDDLVRELKLSGNLPNILKKEQESEEEGTENVSLDDFELLAVLGRGGFGKVMQVRHIPTNEVYAMKILKKSELRRRRQVERTQTERTILANVRHPFIVCLHYAFQNAQKLYMVMDFVQGGDFFTLMRKFKRIPEEWVRLYVIEVAMALQHLHDMDVVYRDLKPENILLCGDGHLKLTDFGLSRFFETRPPAAEDMIGEDDVVTRSFCGTEQYMSPEMLLQQGHNHRMDWWCLGLLMHEMISARHPFHGPSHYDTLRNMVTKPPVIDSRLSPGASAVVKSFLIKNPRARLCCREGIAEMKASPFFGAIDWDALYKKQIKMPYMPKLQNETDLSSFETTFTREKPIDSVMDADKDDSKKKNKNGGIMGFLGYGNATSGKEDGNGESDSFKGFSFMKEEEQGAPVTTTAAVPEERTTFSENEENATSITSAPAVATAPVVVPVPVTIVAPPAPPINSPKSNLTHAIKTASKEGLL